jgi:hypothetical protein
MSDEDLLKNISVRTTVRMGDVATQRAPTPTTPQGGVGVGYKS